MRGYQAEKVINLLWGFKIYWASFNVEKTEE